MHFRTFIILSLLLPAVAAPLADPDDSDYGEEDDVLSLTVSPGVSVKDCRNVLGGQVDRREAITILNSALRILNHDDGPARGESRRDSTRDARAQLIVEMLIGVGGSSDSLVMKDDTDDEDWSIEIEGGSGKKTRVTAEGVKNVIAMAKRRLKPVSVKSIKGKYALYEPYKLPRLIKAVEEQGNRQVKQAAINKYAFDRFLQARYQLKVVKF